MQFCPNGGSQNVSANDSGTARITLTGLDALTGAVRIYNQGTAVLYTRFGTGTFDAAQYDCPVAPNSAAIFLVPEGDDEVAFYGSSMAIVTIGQLR